MLFEVVELARACAHCGVLAACRARIGAGIPGSDALPSPRPGRHSTPHARTAHRPDPITTVRLLHSIHERLRSDIEGGKHHQGCLKTARAFFEARIPAGRNRSSATQPERRMPRQRRASGGGRGGGFRARCAALGTPATGRRSTRCVSPTWPARPPASSASRPAPSDL